MNIIKLNYNLGYTPEPTRDFTLPTSTTQPKTVTIEINKLNAIIKGARTFAKNNPYWEGYVVALEEVRDDVIQ